MKQFWRSLCRHPGVLPASIMTVAGFLAGIDRDLQTAIVGASIMAAMSWPFVLITAWTGRKK